MKKVQEEAVQKEENADESILKSISEELIKTLQQNKTNEKFLVFTVSGTYGCQCGIAGSCDFCVGIS